MKSSFVTEFANNMGRYKPKEIGQRKRGNWTQEQMDRCMQDVFCGMPVKRTAKYYGIPAKTILRRWVTSYRTWKLQDISKWEEIQQSAKEFLKITENKKKWKIGQ